MAKHYCHQCAAKLGLIRPLPAVDLTGSNAPGATKEDHYRFKKYVTHTVPTASAKPIVSFFDDPSAANYVEYTVNAHASGSVEIDAGDRTNIVWYAAREMGFTMSGGVVTNRTDAVKLALHDTLYVHPIPTGSAGFATERCAECGEVVVR